MRKTQNTAGSAKVTRLHRERKVRKVAEEERRSRFPRRKRNGHRFLRREREGKKFPRREREGGTNIRAGSAGAASTAQDAQGQDSTGSTRSEKVQRREREPARAQEARGCSKNVECEATGCNAGSTCEGQTSIRRQQQVAKSCCTATSVSFRPDVGCSHKINCPGRVLVCNISTNAQVGQGYHLKPKSPGIVRIPVMA